MKKYIAVLDSGVGGINILRECANLMKSENFVYYADIKNAPYGNKSKCKIMKCLCAAINELLSKYKIKMIILACNTATAVCINDLRKIYDIPVVGIDPAIKLAVDKVGEKEILVLATSATVKYSAVIKKYRRNKSIKVLKQKKLAKLIDGNLADLSVLSGYINKKFSKYKNINAVVLGCTHYIFIKNIFEKVFVNAQFFEASMYVALRAKKLLSDSSSLKRNGKGIVLFLTSGEDEKYKTLLKQQFIL